MKRETRLFTLLSLSSALLLSGVAHAQAPTTPGATTPGVPAPGTVTNQTVTSESTTVVPGTEMTSETTMMEDAAPLENTGGEPLLFAIGGALLAGSALVMRRRLSNTVR